MDCTEVDMNVGKIVSRMGVVLVGVSALGLSGCGEEDIGSVAQAIGPECAAAAPTASFISTINYTSPQTYNPPYCWKGVVLDVENYASTAPPGYWIYTNIGWADSVPLASEPNHVTNCNNLWMQADLFEEVNGVPVFRASREAYGTWLTGFPAANTCWGPGVNFNDMMVVGKTYRISATARTYKNGGAPTRKLSVLTSFVNPPR
jgi:hypothetical protein